MRCTYKLKVQSVAYKLIGAIHLDFPRFCLCESAEAEDVFSSLPDLRFRSTFPAADAAFFLVTLQVCFLIISLHNYSY